MKRLGLAFLVVCGFLLGVGTASAAGKSWKGRMQDLSSALREAIPFLYPDPSQDPKVLTEKIKAIYEATKQLDGKIAHSVKVPDSDPALPYLASLLNSDIERAYQSLQEGHTEYAKSVVRSSVSYCIACHTRNDGGVHFPVLQAFTEPLKRASWIERIEFQAASRQFDTVLSEVMGQLEKSEKLGVNGMDLENASRIALSILVRVKKDPVRATFLTKAIEKSPAATFSLKESARVWQKDIAAWAAEKDKSFSTDAEMMTEARRLLRTTEKDEAPGFAHAEVGFLRTSVLMHEMLKRFPKSEFTAEAFYMIGLAYDSLRELGLWSLHEMYFMACIKKVPHTDLSERCFAKYRESVTLGYTGSSGVHIPSAVRKHLDNVHAMAKKEKL